MHEAHIFLGLDTLIFINHSPIYFDDDRNNTGRSPRLCCELIATTNQERSKLIRLTQSLFFPNTTDQCVGVVVETSWVYEILILRAFPNLGSSTKAARYELPAAILSPSAAAWEINTIETIAGQSFVSVVLLLLYYFGRACGKIKRLILKYNEWRTSFINLLPFGCWCCCCCYCCFPNRVFSISNIAATVGKISAEFFRTNSIAGSLDVET